MGINKLPDKKDVKTFVWVIYALQFIALFTVGLSFLLSGFLAYMKYDENIGLMEESHLQWQIKTFWSVLFGLSLGVFFIFFFIGKFILLLTELWLIYRVVKGSIFLTQGRGVNTDGFF
ncbi:Probable transmembrane protein [hydrothermal vent metagenome]|uniref:Probable transmembrane protein n=1 Tax=hydrothermal vent metagenome TaxID=652676 RepID=A0A1W1C8W7_9ZZZZ